MSELDDLRERLRAFADSRDWHRFHTPKNLLMALSGEVGELISELQWHSDADADPRAWDDGLRERVADEVADVLIYLVRFADVCAIDPIAAAHAKIERNEQRFPRGAD
ncbi:MAG: nucleotide pyrophosphohydrolase [Pseudonocardia sp.]